MIQEIQRIRAELALVERVIGEFYDKCEQVISENKRLKEENEKLLKENESKNDKQSAN